MFIQDVPERKQRRRYRFFKYGFFVLLALFALFFYSQYDYLTFKILITQNYIFTDSLDTLYAEAVGIENVKSYWKNFDHFVIASATEKIRMTSGDRYTALYTPQRSQRIKDTDIAVAQTAHYLPISADTVYVKLPNISTNTRKFMQDNKEAINAYDNLVLDVRGNYGGLLADHYRIAELFTAKGSIIGYERTRLSIFTNEIKNKREPFFSFKQIIILMDNNTASAAEGLIWALRANMDNVSLLGERTYGKGIGQVTIPLRRGYAVNATVLLVEGPGGGSIHNRGIAPDITMEDEDDWIEAAAAAIIEKNK